MVLLPKQTYPKYHLREVVRQRRVEAAGRLPQQDGHLAGEGDEHGVDEEEDGLRDGEVQQPLYVLDVTLVQLQEVTMVRHRDDEAHELENRSTRC